MIDAHTYLAHAGAVPATDVELIVFLLVGLLGGAHCLGMCGPLVTMYSETLQSQSEASTDGHTRVLTFREVRQHALFNLGRAGGYALIGGLFGLAGALFFNAAGLVEAVGTTVRVVSGVVVGALILAVGVQYTLGRESTHDLLGGSPFARVYGRFASHVEKWVTGPGIIGLGLVHGLLPCPILYPAFLYAFARGSPETGAVVLGTLGVGTIPTLFLYGTVIQSIGPTHRAYLHRALGIAFLLMGWMPIGHGLGLLGIEIPHIEVPMYQPL